MSDSNHDRRMGRAWRNGLIAMVAVGILVLGTHGVLSAIDAGPLAEQSKEALEVCGPDRTKSVSKDGFVCEE